jgi:hypothetical protein
MVVFKLETLSQHGKPAVSAIRVFLGRNLDVDYNQQESNTTTNQNDANGGVFSGGNNGNGINFKSPE